MILFLLTTLWTWKDVTSKPKQVYNTDWTWVQEDCPDSSCGVIFNQTEYLSFLRFRFVPETTFDLYRRRYMWFYTFDHKEVGRMIVSENEGHWIQINKGACHEDVKFTSTNATNKATSYREIIIRATANGVHITFPDNGTWATCTEWRVQRIAFDKWKRVQAQYTLVSDDKIKDLCAATYNNGSQCTGTAYCTSKGFCEAKRTQEMCEKTLDNTSYCKSCSIEHSPSCNSTAHCISPEWLCNGIVDCDNGEDELNCPEVSEQDICEGKGGQFTSDGTCVIPKSSAKKNLIHDILFVIMILNCSWSTFDI